MRELSLPERRAREAALASEGCGGGVASLISQRPSLEEFAATSAYDTMVFSTDQLLQSALETCVGLLSTALRGSGLASPVVLTELR